MTNTVFYTASRYQVVLAKSPLKEEERDKYGVQNIATNVIEYFVDTLDNAMIAAETLSYILDNSTWRNQVQLNIESIKEVAPKYEERVVKSPLMCN